MKWSDSGYLVIFNYIFLHLDTVMWNEAKPLHVLWQEDGKFWLEYLRIKKVEQNGKIFSKKQQISIDL